MIQPQERPSLIGATSRWLFIFSLFGGAIGYQAYAGDYPAAGVLMAIAIAAFSGHRAGMSGILGLVAGVAAAFHFSTSVARFLEPQLNDWIHQDGLVGRCCGIGVAGIGIVLVTMLTIRLVAYLFAFSWPAARTWDRRMGFVVGALNGGAASLVLVSGLLAVEPLLQQQLAAPDAGPRQAPGRLVAQTASQAADWTQHSIVGQLAKQYDPFERVEYLHSLKRGLLVANDPVAFEKLAQHPSLAAFKEREDVQAAAQRLQTDPQVQQVLGAEQKLEPKSLLALLKNAAVLKFCDETGLFEELARILPGLDWSGSASRDTAPRVPRF